ncbi:MAG: hypothetical protein Terrestrivirus1_152 [Terrestrivirus sp.]|uniref:Uncharacterized protein n=1 Tax=Terrestrivirus sp. TaxID=2487775 RepID=A0A3G4ZKB5_9VIRU|nr:MAG: hypothetical protein Terrestrivirus1_152 [Terrestrivirus sp.]
MTPEDFINNINVKDVKRIFQTHYSQDGDKSTSCFTVKYKDDHETVVCKTAKEIGSFDVACYTKSISANVENIVHNMDKKK